MPQGSFRSPLCHLSPQAVCVQEQRALGDCCLSPGAHPPLPSPLETPCLQAQPWTWGLSSVGGPATSWSGCPCGHLAPSRLTCGSRVPLPSPHPALCARPWGDRREQRWPSGSCTSQCGPVLECLLAVPRISGRRRDTWEELTGTCWGTLSSLLSLGPGAPWNRAISGLSGRGCTFL